MPYQHIWTSSVTQPGYSDKNIHKNDKKNKDWRFAGVFYDVKSGLRRNGRTELDKMLKKAEKGNIFTKYKSFIGYICVDDNLAIVPEQAEVVRKIFELIFARSFIRANKVILGISRDKNCNGKRCLG